MQQYGAFHNDLKGHESCALNEPQSFTKTKDKYWQCGFFCPGKEYLRWSRVHKQIKTKITRYIYTEISAADYTARICSVGCIHLSYQLKNSNNAAKKQTPPPPRKIILTCTNKNQIWEDGTVKTAQQTHAWTQSTVSVWAPRACIHLVS